MKTCDCIVWWLVKIQEFCVISLQNFLMYFTEPVSYILHFVTIHKNVPWNKMRKNNCFHWLHIKTLCFVTSISTVFLFFFLIAKISKFKFVYVETNLVPIFSQKDLFIWCFTAQNDFSISIVTIVVKVFNIK